MKDKKVIYYLGNEAIKERISGASRLTGCELKEKNNFKNEGIVIYSLNQDLSNYILKLEKTPENLIIISKGERQYSKINPNIYIYNSLKYNKLEYSFSKYLNEYLKNLADLKSCNEIKVGEVGEVDDFYQLEDIVNIYYLKSEESFPFLKDLAVKKYKVEEINLKQIQIPGKYFLFIKGTDFEMKWIKKNHDKLENTVIIGYKCEKKIKKELKRSNFSVPVIFTKKFNKRLLH